MQMSLKFLITSFILPAVVRGSRDLIPFSRLQVSSPMVVEVITEPKRSQASLDVAADSLGLGWTVKASVEPMTFGYTLLLGMDERAIRQGYHWSSSSGKATLRVPEPLKEVSTTGGAKVLVDVVTNAVLADTKSSLTVMKFETPNVNRTSFFMSSTGANITVQEGMAGKAFVNVGAGCTMKLGCLVSEAAVEADATAKLFINADSEELNVNEEEEGAVKIIDIVGEEEPEKVIEGLNASNEEEEEEEEEEVIFEKDVATEMQGLEASPVIP